MQLEQELEQEHEQLVKGVNKNVNWKKKEMLLVERLIGTEKRKKKKKKIHLSEYIIGKWSNQKSFGALGTYLQYMSFLKCSLFFF